MQVRRAYKLRAYPTRPQETRAERLLHDHCDLYNAALQERREAWRKQQKWISTANSRLSSRRSAPTDPNRAGSALLHRTAADAPSAAMWSSEPSTRRDLSEATTSQRLGSPRFKALNGSTKSCSLQETGPSGSPPERQLGTCKLSGGRSAEGEAAPTGCWPDQDVAGQAGASPLVVIVVTGDRGPAAAVDRPDGRHRRRVWSASCSTSDGESSPTRGSSTGPRPRSRISNGVRSAPSVAPATTSESGGSLPANGGGSETSATTSTTRPPEPSWARTT